MPHSKICINKFVFILSFLSENRRKGKEIFQTGKQYVTFLTNKTSFYKSERLPEGRRSRCSRTANRQRGRAVPTGGAWRICTEWAANVLRACSERVPCPLRTRTPPASNDKCVCCLFISCYETPPVPCGTKEKKAPDKAGCPTAACPASQACGKAALPMWSFY